MVENTAVKTQTQKVYPLNLLNLVAMGIGSIVGAGIFALLGQVILQAGAMTYWSFVLAGVAALFSGYSYAKLAGRYPDSGGLTDYFRIAYPRKAVSGTLTLIYVITSAVSISMMAKSFGIYAANFLGETFNYGLTVNLFATILIFALSFLNMLGSSDVGKTETFLVAVKLLILLSLVVFAVAKLDYAPDFRDIHPTPIAFLGSVGITFFAFAGYGIITNAAADVRHPRRTIAWGIFLTIIIVILLYMGLAFVVLSYIPESELRRNADVAVAIVAGKLMGQWGYWLLYLTAFIAFVTGINATYFSIFRITHSLAHEGILPYFYVRKLWHFGTFGNLLTTVLIWLATVCFDFSAIVNLASGAYLVSYLAVFVANWRLRVETGSSPFLIITGLLLMLFILITFIISIVI